jgi:hypothetical protein
MAAKTPRIELEYPAKKGLSSVGDWVAPFLVWMLCIGMLSALLSALLGRAD